MQISHRFVKLSEQDSGKQHLFTWRDDDGKFLCHAMYQSGADMLDVGGGQAQRGQVLRILTKEITSENEADSAPSKDAESGTLRFHITADAWQATDYQDLARFVAGNPALDEKQRTAVICQLGSLYNLMATRYGKLFYNTLAIPTAKAVDDLVTDPALRQVSNWFASKGAQMLGGKKLSSADMGDLELHQDVPQANTKKLSFGHGIIARDGQKIHTFSIKNAGGKELLDAEFQSGSLGETIVIKYPLEGGKAVAIPYNLMTLPDFLNEEVETVAAQTGEYETIRDKIADLYQPVGDKYQLQKVDYYRQLYHLSPEQQAATLIMLGSVTRLFATRYQRGFEPVSVGSEEELHNYIKVRDISKVADNLLEAGSKLLRDGKLEYPRLPVRHTSFGTKRAIDELSAEDATLDVTHFPAPDFWLMLGKLPESLQGANSIFTKYGGFLHQGPGNRAVQVSQAK